MLDESAIERPEDVQTQIRVPDRLIAKLADQQHGVVARQQLLYRGLSREAIAGRIDRGQLHCLHRGIYAVGHRVVSRHGRWMAAVLACGTEAVLSHRSAAALWWLRRPSSGTPEVTTPRSCRSSQRIRRHCAALLADEVTTRDGIPVTTVPRTLFDLAAVLSTDAVERAMREAERLRLDDRLSLEDLLVRHPRHRGARTIRECLKRRRELPGGVTREELEQRFVIFLDRSGLPRPRLNAWLKLNARHVQVDCLWKEASVVVELDGHATHGTRTAFEDDRERDRRLQAAGYRVIRVTWRQLRDTPGAIAGDLRTLLAESSAIAGDVR